VDLLLGDLLLLVMKVVKYQFVINQEILNSEDFDIEQNRYIMPQPNKNLKRFSKKVFLRMANCFFPCGK